jgi:calcineurin-like phosphoesterase family protein
MNEGLIRRWNERVKPNDTVYHIGDFSFRSTNGNRLIALEWESRLNGKIIHCAGNHDKASNGVNCSIKKAIMNVGPYEALVQHIPPTMPLEVPDFVSFCIVGHVHNNWHFQYDPEGPISVPMINVGVDVNNYYPIREDALVELYERIVRDHEGGKK